MGNNLGGFIQSGVIGGIIACISWYVVNMVIVEPSVYVAVGLAGFFGSFFSALFAAKWANEKVEA
ncbi:MAG: hypothetical protein AAEJ04_11885 [Planctomycetota bacterium]